MPVRTAGSGKTTSETCTVQKRLGGLALAFTSLPNKSIRDMRRSIRLLKIIASVILDAPSHDMVKRVTQDYVKYWAKIRGALIKLHKIFKAARLNEYGKESEDLFLRGHYIWRMWLPRRGDGDNCGSTHGAEESAGENRTGAYWRDENSILTRDEIQTVIDCLVDLESFLHTFLECAELSYTNMLTRLKKSDAKDSVSPKWLRHIEKLGQPTANAYSQVRSLHSNNAALHHLKPMAWPVRCPIPEEAASETTGKIFDENAKGEGIITVDMLFASHIANCIMK